MPIKCTFKVEEEIILTWITNDNVAGKLILLSVLQLLARGFGRCSTLCATRDVDLSLVNYCIYLQCFELLFWWMPVSLNETSWR